MRKILLGLVATAALATPLAAATAANASVAFDGSTGHVDKGDVQTALKWNNADFDKGVNTLTFTSTGTTTLGNETRWQCNDGSVQSRTSLVTFGTSVTATPVLNSNGKQITGWNLTSNQYGSYLGGKYVGQPYVGAGCDASGFAGFLPNVFTTDVSNGGLKVNGVDLPNTPVI
jgi:opacity protein-like surface antigen